MGRRKIGDLSLPITIQQTFHTHPSTPTSKALSDSIIPPGDSTQLKTHTICACKGKSLEDAKQKTALLYSNGKCVAVIGCEGFVIMTVWFEHCDSFVAEDLAGGWRWSSHGRHDAVCRYDSRTVVGPFRVQTTQCIIIQKDQARISIPKCLLFQIQIILPSKTITIVSISLNFGFSNLLDTRVPIYPKQSLTSSASAAHQRPSSDPLHQRAAPGSDCLQSPTPPPWPPLHY